jgi:hypothetical protein
MVSYTYGFLDVWFLVRMVSYTYGFLYVWFLIRMVSYTLQRTLLIRAYVVYTHVWFQIVYEHMLV